MVVLLAPGAGWTFILLVLTAALGAHIVGPRGSAAIVAGNTVVAGTAARFAGGEALEVGLTAFLYLLLQTVSVMAVVV